MEQYMIMKRVFNMALIMVGALAAVYIAVIKKNYSSLWLIFFFLLLFYFIVGDFIVGAAVFGPVKKIIRWAAGQKIKEPDRTNAGELSATAAKLLRNGNLTAAKELLDEVFALKRVGPNRMMFANTILADVLRTEGEVEKSIRTLKNSVLKKKRETGCYSLFVLGRAYLQQGNYDKAIEAFEDANALLKDGELGIPDLFKARAKNRTMRNYYGETLTVFVPFYLGKSQFWSPGGDEQAAAENLNKAVVLCRNRHLRPLLKQDFAEKE